MKLKIIPKLLQWHNKRPKNAIVNTIVLHATDGASALSSIAWQAISRTSYHYIIERDGTVYKCTPISLRAWHAGVSFGPQGNDVNNYSVGICFANFESKGESLTAVQIAACAELIEEIQLATNNQFKWVTRHKTIAPTRKTDPKMLTPTALSKIAMENNLIIWNPAL